MADDLDLTVAAKQYEALQKAVADATKQLEEAKRRFGELSAEAGRANDILRRGENTLRAFEKQLDAVTLAHLKTVTSAKQSREELVGLSNVLTQVGQIGRASCRERV